MKTLFTFLMVVLVTSFSWGQADTVFIKYNIDKFEDKPNYKTDTVIFDTPNARQILYGTTVLPWTQNQQIAKNYGLYLDTVSMTPCKQDLGARPNTIGEVLSVNHHNDSLTIELNYWGNCCHSFLCDIEVRDDNTVNLIIHGYGATYCSCQCCFGLTYHLTTFKGIEFEKLKYIMVNDDEKTKMPIPLP
jgi:hypothetical protein